MQRGIGLPAARQKKTLPKSCDKLFVLLPGGEYGRNDPSLRAGENLDQLPHLAAHVRG